MSVVTIPFDYDKLKDPSSVVPICIEDTDREGRRIAWGWFTAVVPIANRLRHLARQRLDDVWRVSELAESTVHAVWYKYGDNLGLWPTSRLWHHAKWNVEDLRVGGWRARQSVEEPLPEDETALDAIIQRADRAALSALMPGGRWDFEKEIERRQFFDALVKKMKMRGDIQAGEMVELLCHGMDREEISALFDKRPNTLAQNLHRSIRRALKELGLA
jgi:DNA-directed RNA polymerase specialized sigma24 family protein